MGGWVVCYMVCFRFRGPAYTQRLPARLPALGRACIYAGNSSATTASLGLLGDGVLLAVASKVAFAFGRCRW